MSKEISHPETCTTLDYTGDRIYSELPPTCCAQQTAISNHKTEQIAISEKDTKDAV